MANKLLVTLHADEGVAKLEELNCKVLAEYPNSALVECSGETVEELHAEGLDPREVPVPPVQLAGRSFAMRDAGTVTELPSNSTDEAYFIAQLVGPSKGAWLRMLEESGAHVVGSLKSYALILKMAPAQVETVAGLDWIEAVVPYHSVLKLSPRLRLTGQGPVSRREFDAPLAVDRGDPTLQVEITTFPGEEVEPVIAAIREAGDTVLASSSNSVKAFAKQSTIGSLVKLSSVQLVQPFAFPSYNNNVARTVLETPSENNFPTGIFDGSGQIVAVCDSGLDTGDVATVHPDLRGRVLDIVSWPSQFDPMAQIYLNSPHDSDDGPTDAFSGHGTHVAGSVAGNGAAALAAGASTVPIGVATKAQIFFQSIEQRLNWKSKEQLEAEGIAIPNGPSGPIEWPPAEIGFYGIPDDLEELFRQAYDAGARVHTNSWGANVNGTYNTNSRSVDEAMSGFRDLLVIFAAGNAGNDANNDGQIDLDSIGSPGTAKNCLTVGASENDRPSGSSPTPGKDLNWNQIRPPFFSQMTEAGHVSDNPDGMACFSARGPVDGGRTKPEIVAPGTNLLSARSTLVSENPLWGDVKPDTDLLNGHYCWSGGTSMAAPVVAGLAAVVRQYLIERYGHYEDGVKPSGALIKACLLNGAVPINGQFSGEIPNGANNVTGFGRANSANTIAEIGFDDEPEHALESGQIRTVQVEAVDLSRPLRMTLCWTDPPSTTAGQLQNTLYLQLVTPDGAIVDGEVTRFPNVINNSQQIVIETPIFGTYNIRVRGVDITRQSGGAAPGSNPRQDFALVYSNATGRDRSTTS